MKKEQCTIGTVVKLKSGGPDMTIVARPFNENVECMWFIDEDETSPCKHDFPVAVLDLEIANEDEN